MTEKIGAIKNPLTIIAIFAGIAEVSGTIVLPFINQQNQRLFIWFLISFPSILIILFFVTLIFFTKVLYAPSDWRDEENWFRGSYKDLSSQNDVLVKVKKEELINFNNGNEQFSTEVSENLTCKIKLFSDDVKTIVYEKEQYRFLVTNFYSARDFVREMKEHQIDFSIYHQPLEEKPDKTFADYQSIWIGDKVDINCIKKILKLSKEFFPHLKYLKISSGGPRDQVYIGGATSAAKRDGLKLLTDNDFDEIDSFETLKELHFFIDKHNG